MPRVISSTGQRIEIGTAIGQDLDDGRHFDTAAPALFWHDDSVRIGMATREPYGLVHNIWEIA
jgi:hypothetical protein